MTDCCRDCHSSVSEWYFLAASHSQGHIYIVQNSTCLRVKKQFKHYRITKLLAWLSATSVSVISGRRIHQLSESWTKSWAKIIFLLSGRLSVGLILTVRLKPLILLGYCYCFLYYPLRDLLGRLYTEAQVHHHHQMLCWVLKLVLADPIILLFSSSQTHDHYSTYPTEIFSQ